MFSPTHYICDTGSLPLWWETLPSCQRLDVCRVLMIAADRLKWPQLTFPTLVWFMSDCTAASSLRVLDCVLRPFPANYVVNKIPFIACIGLRNFLLPIYFLSRTISSLFPLIRNSCNSCDSSWVEIPRWSCWCFP